MPFRLRPRIEPPARFGKRNQDKVTVRTEKEQKVQGSQLDRDL